MCRSESRTRTTIKVLNPLPSHCGYTSLEHARRLVKQCRAELLPHGLVMYRPIKRAPQVHRGSNLMVDAFSGMDAFPGRAVLPPSPEFLRSQA